MQYFYFSIIFWDVGQEYVKDTILGFIDVPPFLFCPILWHVIGQTIVDINKRLVHHLAAGQFCFFTFPPPLSHSHLHLLPWKPLLALHCHHIPFLSPRTVPVSFRGNRGHKAFSEQRGSACYIQTHSRFRVDRTPHCSTMHTSNKLEEKQPARRDREGGPREGEWARVGGTMLGSGFLCSMQRQGPVLHGCRPRPLLHACWFQIGIGTEQQA